MSSPVFTETRPSLCSRCRSHFKDAINHLFLIIRIMPPCKAGSDAQIDDLFFFFSFSVLPRI